MPTAASAEYDCAQYCRLNNTSSETGSLCNDNIDNDWDAVYTTGYYSNQYSSNTTFGAGIDCRWGGYYGYGSNYNPDENCNNTILSNGYRCQLAKEQNCTDGFDNDYDHDAAGMPSAGWGSNTAGYQAYFGKAYSTDADFDDYDCRKHTSAPARESINSSWCFDGIDNDLDRYFWNSTPGLWQQNSSTGTDCYDPDCFGAGCAELCDELGDNDLDGLINCDDPDCVAAPECGG